MIAYANVKQILFYPKGRLNLMTFIECVKQVRISLGMSQYKFAKEIKINYTTLNRWEKGRIVPSRLARNSFFVFCRKKGINVPVEVYDECELP
jgi:DNA-binding transcriptional regulator YiaG